LEGAPAVNGQTLVIRPLTAEAPEWERVAAFAQDCSWRAGSSLARAMRGGAFTIWERVFAAFSCDAEGNESIAGYCTLAQKDCIEGLPYTPYIGYVFVAETYRGRGLCGLLLNAAMEAARALGFEAVYLISDHDGLYEKYGFTVIDRRQAPWGSIEKIYNHAL
jgi:N-acetylglutamate synthase-like GNAT family acetyltransferase